MGHFDEKESVVEEVETSEEQLTRAGVVEVREGITHCVRVADCDEFPSMESNGKCWSGLETGYGEKQTRQVHSLVMGLQGAGVV